MYVDPTVTPEGPRSLHFRGNCPIPRLQKLASSCARPQAAALRDVAVSPSTSLRAVFAALPTTLRQLSIDKSFPL